MEDEPLITLDLALAVEDIGAEVIGPVAIVADALALIHRGGIAAAVIDANLLNRDVTPVAIELIDRSLPFVVHTGTGLPAELACLHSGLPLIAKPAPARSVVSELIRKITEVNPTA